MNNLNDCICFIFSCLLLMAAMWCGKGRALRRDPQPATLPRYPLGRGSQSAGRERLSKPAAKLSGALLNCAAHILGATQDAAAAVPLQCSSSGGCCCLFVQEAGGGDAHLPPPSRQEKHHHLGQAIQSIMSIICYHFAQLQRFPPPTRWLYL